MNSRVPFESSSASSRRRRGAREIQGARLALEQSQVVTGIERARLPIPDPLVDGDEGVATHDSDAVDPTDHGHLLMRVLCWHGVAVAIKANQGL